MQRKRKQSMSHLGVGSRWSRRVWPTQREAGTMQVAPNGPKHWMVGTVQAS